MDAVTPESDRTIALGLQFRHPLLQLMPFPSRAPAHLLAVQDLISAALNADASRAERIEAVVNLVALPQRSSSRLPDGRSLLLEVLGVVSRHLASPLVDELLAQLHLKGDGITVVSPDQQDLTSTGLPWVARLDALGSPTAATGVPVMNAALGHWSTAVQRVQSLPAAELQLLHPEEIRAAIRCLQLHCLYGRDFRSPLTESPRRRLREYEHMGAALWDLLLQALRSTARDASALSFLDDYDERARHRTWLRLRSEAMTAEEAEEGQAAPVSGTQSGLVANPVHVVISGRIPAAGASDDRPTLERFEALRQPLPVSRLPEPAAIQTMLSRLQAEFPWAHEAVSLLCDDLLTRRLYGSIEVGSSPTLLVGMPGCGKSRLVRRIAEELGVPFLPLAMAGMIDAMALTGTARGWSTGQPAPLIALLEAHRSASAFVLLDEIDKVAASARNAVPPTVALLSLLEPEGAARWYDTYLQTPCDLTRVMFWATANRLDPLPNALLSRFRVVLVPEPDAEHFDLIAAGAIKDIAASWRLPAGALPHVSLRDSPLKPRNAREVRLVVHRLLSAWASNHCRPEQRH